MKDYYKTLGVSENASKEDIKKAFKTLAKKHHPDINKGDKKSEEKFKELSEAYEVLGREEERRKYDSARTGRGSFRFDGFSKEGPFGDFFHSSNGPTGGGSDFFEEILRSFGGLGGGNPRGSGGSTFGGFDHLFGGNSARSSSSGHGSNATLKIPLSTALNGGKISVSGLPGGTQTVDVPANSHNGQIINVSTYQGAFTLKLQIEDEHPFRVKGKNVETTVNINLGQAVLGGKIKLKGPRGDDFIITVPAGSQNSDILRLRGLGLGGDLLVKLEVAIPTNLDQDQKSAFAELAQKMGWKY